MDSSIKKEIRKSIQILALNNLIEDYSEFLETKENLLTEEEKELAYNIINEATEMIQEFDNSKSIRRPTWGR